MRQRQQRTWQTRQGQGVGELRRVVANRFHYTFQKSVSPYMRLAKEFTEVALYGDRIFGHPLKRSRISIHLRIGPVAASASLVEDFEFAIDQAKVGRDGKSVTKISSMRDRTVVRKKRSGTGR